MEKKLISSYDLRPEDITQIIKNGYWPDRNLVFRLGVIEDTATENRSDGINRLDRDTQDYLAEMGIVEHIIKEDVFRLRMTELGNMVLQHCRADTPEFILESERRNRERKREELENLGRNEWFGPNS